MTSSKWFFALVSALVCLAPATVFAQRSDAGSAVSDAAAPSSSTVREVEIVVDNGYTPSVIDAVEGERLRLRFVRRDYSPCSREVVFPSINVRRMLPTNQPVVIELGPLAVGEVPFQCWMNMLRGRVVVRARPSAAPAVDAGAAAPVTRPAPRTARPSRRGR
ncbi:MAG: cupredoxin domain-containing protein [Polyangiales bacterium]